MSKTEQETPPEPKVQQNLWFDYSLTLLLRKMAKETGKSLSQIAADAILGHAKRLGIKNDG